MPNNPSNIFLKKRISSKFPYVCWKWMQQLSSSQLNMLFGLLNDALIFLLGYFTVQTQIQYYFVAHPQKQIYFRELLLSHAHARLCLVDNYNKLMQHFWRSIVEFWFRCGFRRNIIIFLVCLFGGSLSQINLSLSFVCKCMQHYSKSVRCAYIRSRFSALKKQAVSYISACTTMRGNKEKDTLKVRSPKKLTDSF